MQLSCLRRSCQNKLEMCHFYIYKFIVCVRACGCVCGTVIARYRAPLIYKSCVCDAHARNVMIIKGLVLIMCKQKKCVGHYSAKDSNLFICSEKMYDRLRP